MTPAKASDNTTASRLGAVLKAQGVSNVDGHVREWIDSRFDLHDAIAFAANGVLTPQETDGAPRFNAWTPPQKVTTKKVKP